MTAELQIGVAYALLAGALWGIGPLLLKRGMGRATVSDATLTQQFVSVGCLALLAAFRGELLRFDLSGRAFWGFFLAGAVGASFGKIFYYKGIDKVGASKSISVKNSSPFITAILAALFLGEELTLWIIIGVLLIVFGIGILTQGGIPEGHQPSRWRYFFYPIMAALCFAVNPIFKKYGINASSLPVLGALITQTTALVFILTFGQLLDIKPRWKKIPLKSFALFSASGITEGLASLFTFFALVHAPAMLVSPIWRISPLVTFALARFTLKGIEVVTLRDGVAASFIVGGIFVLSRG